MTPVDVEDHSNKKVVMLLAGLLLLAGAALSGLAWMSFSGKAGASTLTAQLERGYRRRQFADTAGYITSYSYLVPWEPTATCQEIGQAFDKLGTRAIRNLDEDLADGKLSEGQRLETLLDKASLENYEGLPKNACQSLEQIRGLLATNESLSREHLYTCIAFQGISSLRQGENDNCIMCRGESSCILPISRAAMHTNPEGSRQAILHFTEYLEEFPEDLEIRWLLNLAHMTLGEYPEKVDPRYLVKIDAFLNSEFDIGKFRDIGHQIGVNSFNQAGGSIMDDFDNDGMLDIVATTYDPNGGMIYYHNDGKGRFENRTKDAQLSDQWGGLNCMQTDFNNDGFLDIFIVRGAWLSYPMRPSLLRNNQDGTFTDVTEEVGLLNPANSITASWADYDNDGWLDLFVACEKQISRLYRNNKGASFEDVSESSGLFQKKTAGKGIAWIDYDNDGHQDLFVNYLIKREGAQLFRNNGDGTFRDVTREQGINGPLNGFSCWAWDYDNDGWLDIFATCYDRDVGEIVKGLQGEPHQLNSNRLFHNQQGKGFVDVTREAGLDMVLATMGSNYTDLDNDGYLDMYLGTGEPELGMLVPNRMFKNVGGHRFADITASSGTGNLQKGHGVSCGDWNRDGNNDIFIQMGGAIPGDKYHSIMFQNPGHDNNWLTVKLVGNKSNRAAIGARIKIVTAGQEPRTLHRHISSGSSFGANALQQTIGLGKTEQIALLEINWPTSHTTQVFRDIKPDQSIEITEFAEDYKTLDRSPIAVPE